MGSKKKIDASILEKMLKQKRVKNGGISCDMVTGPCSCGAWHTEDEIDSRTVSCASSTSAPKPRLKLVK